MLLEVLANLLYEFDCNLKSQCEPSGVHFDPYKPLVSHCELEFWLHVASAVKTVLLSVAAFVEL